MSGLSGGVGTPALHRALNDGANVGFSCGNIGHARCNDSRRLVALAARHRNVAPAIKRTADDRAGEEIAGDQFRGAARNHRYGAMGTIRTALAIANLAEVIALAQALHGAPGGQGTAVKSTGGELLQLAWRGVRGAAEYRAEQRNHGLHVGTAKKCGHGA